MRRCPWWLRWWHRRQRTADALFMLPALRLAAEESSTCEPLSAEWWADVEARMDAGFAIFKQQPGQEHWRCPCSKGAL